MSINNEDYFQINSEILTSFSKYRPQVNLFVWRDSVNVLEPYYKKGGRLTDAQVEELAAMCDAGNVFVARSDQNIYKHHMLRQLDLVLQDPHLTEAEVSELCIAALIMRYREYYEQPVPEVLELLFRDAMVMTEYLWADKHRINPFMRRFFRVARPARHALNTAIAGMFIWMQLSGEYTRKDLDRTLVALLLHDVGMCKIPDFLLAKRNKLSSEDMDKVMQHPIKSVKLMQKSDLKFDELIRACFEHHERLDGSGYPQKIRGAQISPIGKLTAVADSFAAMICERPYARAKEPLQACEELSKDHRYDTTLAGILKTAFVEGGIAADQVNMDERLQSLYKD